MGQTLKIIVNGEQFEVDIVAREPGRVTYAVGGRTYQVEHEQTLPVADIARLVKPKAAVAPSRQTKAGETVIQAPIPGVVLEVLVKKNEQVESGQILIRLEAMKMENNISAPCSGVVADVYVAAGDEVGDGVALLLIR